MARITNGEQIALALQARLQRLKRQERATKPQSPTKVDPKGPDEADPLEAIAAREDLDDDELRRRIVGKLLEQEFGVDFAKDHRFTDLAKRVSDILGRDEDSVVLFRRATEALRDTGSL